MLDEKLKEKDAADALSVADLRSGPRRPRNAALRIFAWLRRTSGCGRRRYRGRARSRPFG